MRWSQVRALTTAVKHNDAAVSRNSEATKKHSSHLVIVSRLWHISALLLIGHK